MTLKELFTSFEGRIRRRDFWLGGIGLSIVMGILYTIVTLTLGTPVPPEEATDLGGYQFHYTFGALGAIVLLILLVFNMWAGLALSIKRWHDRDKSGWWVLINLVPVIGGLWALIETGFLSGTAGPNKYGSDPKAL